MIASFSDRPSGRRVKAGLGWICLLASLVALTYVAQVLVAQWPSVRADWPRIFSRSLALAFAAAASALLILAWTWHWVLRRLGIEVRVVDALHAWFTGNLYKYIPGQVWHVVGRAAKGAQVGVPAGATLGTTVLEQGFSLLIAGTALGVAQRFLPLALGSLVLSVGLLHPAFANATLGLLGRVGSRPLPLVPLRSPQLLFLYLVSLLVSLLSFLSMAAVMLGLGVFRVSDLQGYVVAYMGSFLSGYLFFGSPAGLGVREGSLLVLLGRAGVGAGDAALVAVATRLVTIVTEVALFLASSVLSQGRGGGEMDRR